MDFQTAIATCLRKYATFSGRAARPEFWWFALFGFLGSSLFGILDRAMGVDLLAPIFSLLMLVPSLAVGARRLHDSGRSGWWLLIMLVPILGFLVLLWFYIQPSENENRFGPAR